MSSVTKAEVTTKEIEVVQKVIKPVVVLTMSAEEASTLVKVLDHVRGNPWKTRRAHTDGIAFALREAGVRPANCTFEADRQYIHFAE